MAEHGIVVRGEAVVGAERVGHLCQRLAEMGGEHRLVRDVVGDLAEPVHVIAERDEAGRQAGQFLISVADHGGAKHFVEGADVGQARGAIASFEQDRRAIGFPVWPALQQFARFFIGPGLARQSGISKCVVAQLLPFRSHIAKAGQRGRSFAPSRAPRNPCRHLDRCGRRGARGVSERGDKAAGGDSACTAQCAFGRAAARHRRGVGARFARTVRVRPPGAVRGADGRRSVARRGDRAARQRARFGDGDARHCGGVARSSGRSRLARARGGMDRQRHASPARLDLGAIRCGACREARARRANAVRPAAAMGGTVRPHAAKNGEYLRCRCGSQTCQANRGRSRAAPRAAGDGRRDRENVRPAPSGGGAQHAARRGRDRDWQDAGLSGSSGAVVRAGRGNGLGVDLHQGAATPIGRRGA